MIKFFRKIRQKMLIENKFSKYLIYAIGEIILVVIGILIALQINNLNEQGKSDALTSTYLNNLKLDLLSDLSRIEKRKKEIKYFEKEGYYSLDVIDGKIETIEKERFLKSLIWNNHYPIFQPSRSTYDDLINSGNIKLIKDNDLKVALSKYYMQNDWWEQFGQMAKDTHWRLMREEMFKAVDPFMMKAFYEAEYYPNKEPVVKYEDIEVDFENIGANKSLKNAIKRVLSLRVWNYHIMNVSVEEINKILNILNKITKAQQRV
ncbi:MAG: DUF6090 family protein [Psychroserpens sp.]|uniref:DUF6090 family protein n=1 Tax=Psychroserpens sp. TaxID=2020870 RepID=UPI00300378F5